MNKIVPLLLCLLLVPSAVFARGFEGKIRFSAKSVRHDQPTFCDYSVKDGFLRIDATGRDSNANSQDIVSIWDINQHKLLTLVPDQKTYVSMKTEDIAAPADAPLEKTGETEKILGYDTAKYVFKDGTHGTTEVWTVDGLGLFMSVRSTFVKRGAMNPLEKALATRGLFPLRIVYHNSSGAETSRLEAVSIDKQTLPADTFALPSDYHPFDVGSMSGGF